MKAVVLLSLIFLSAFLLGGNVSARSGTGDTVINATVISEWRLNLSLRFPEILAPENYSFYENATFFQTSPQNISIYLNKSDTNGFVKFVNYSENPGTYYQDNYTLDLPINIHENVTIRVLVPPDQGFEDGNYNVTVYVYSLDDYRSNETTLEIYVNNTNPVDYIEIPNINPSSLYPGESLSAGISIHKVFPSKATDIQTCYCINADPNYQCGPSYNNYGCEWKAISEWLNYTKTVTVNQGPGSYYFIVAEKYPGDENIKRAKSVRFLVKQVPGLPGEVPSPPAGPPEPTQPELNIIAPDYLEASPGERITFDVEIENTGNSDALNTTLDIYGIPENWVSITLQTQDIEIGESKNYPVSISLPSDATEQVYSLTLVGKSGTVESTKTITLTVARTLRDRAKFLLDEAISKREEAEGIIEKAKDMGMDTSEAEEILLLTNEKLDETRRLFESMDYERSIEKAKETIEGYKSVISSVNGIIEEVYFLLMDEVTAELINVEDLTEEMDVIESVKEKINQSMIFQREKRMIGAYEILSEAKQLLDQLKGKIYFRELTQNVVIISILVVMIVAISMVLFYKKRMSRFIKTMRIEEHKKRLSSLFKREVRPSIEYKEKPKMDREKREELRRLLEIGESLAETDIEGAKEAFTEARKIYNSFSNEEKRLIGEEIIRLTRLQNLLKKSR